MIRLLLRDPHHTYPPASVSSSLQCSHAEGPPALTLYGAVTGGLRKPRLFLTSVRLSFLIYRKEDKVGRSHREQWEKKENEGLWS